MKTESANSAELADTLEALRRELAALGERVAALEKAAGSGRPAVAPATADSSPESISEEIILVIAAAVAASLGKKAPIRQIRLLGSTVWAQQGRVTIQASHTL